MELEQTLVDRGCRMTPQRRAVLQVLVDGPRHPTAADVHGGVAQRLPSVSLATVYNTLQCLADFGALLKLPFPGEARFDTDTRPHVNVVCDACGAIHDLPGAALGLVEQARLVAQASGYTLVAPPQLVYHGLCPACAQPGPASPMDGQGRCEDASCGGDCERCGEDSGAISG